MKKTTYSFITIFGIIEMTVPDWYTRVTPVYKGMKEILQYTIGRHLGDHATMGANLDYVSCQELNYALAMSYGEFSIHPEKPVSNYMWVRDVFYGEEDRKAYERSLIRTKKEVSYAYSGKLCIKGVETPVIASYEDCAWCEVMLPKLTGVDGNAIPIEDVQLDEKGEASPFFCITKAGYGSSPMGVYKQTKQKPLEGKIPYYWTDKDE